MDLLPVDVARDRILNGVEPLPGEQVALSRAGGRVLAEPLIARRRQPPFTAAAMDGYALRSIGTEPGTRLRLVGESAAGSGFDKPVGPGEAIRIFTGAPLPEGADAVMMQEVAEFDGDDLLVNEPITALRHVRPAGIDFDIGEELLASGRLLGPRELALAAAANYDSLSVRRVPRISVLSIGDELVPPGSEPEQDQTIASNATAITELARAAGAAAGDLGIIADQADRVAASATEASANADVFVTIGGASVGDHDITRAGLADAGMKLSFWRIAMRPGKPLVFGGLGEMAVLGLPGNPVSSFVCGLVFLQPLIRALLGLGRDDGHEPAILAVELPANGARTTYLRARLVAKTSGLPEVEPLPEQDSSLLRVLAEADCLLVRPPWAELSSPGGLCNIIRLATSR